MSKKSVGKNDLINVAKELNEVMGLDPEIKTGTKRKIEELESDIRSAATQLMPDDDLTPETFSVLELMEVPLPEPVQEETTKTDGPVETAPSTKKKKKKEDTGERSKFGNCRLGSAAALIDEQLEKSGQTKQQIAEGAGCSMGRINAHFKFLQTKKGFKIETDDNGLVTISKIEAA